MPQVITFDKFIRWSLMALAAVAVFLIIKGLSEVLLPFFIAWFLAYLLYPIVKFVQYKLHVPGRAISIIVTLAFVVAIITAIFMFIIPPMLDQVDRFTHIINRYVPETAHTSNIAAIIQRWILENQEHIEKYLKSPDFTNTIKTAMPKLFSVIGQTASIVISIIASVITLLYMFFILLDYETLTENWIKIFPKNVRPFWAGLAKDVERELNNYIRGQGLVSLCLGILFCIGFTIIDFPMAIGMGILIGILNLIPYLHTFALIPTAFLALLNPAILLLSLSVWGALLGFIGLIIALPLTTLIIAYLQRYVTKEHKLNEVEASSAPTEAKDDDKK